MNPAFPANVPVTPVNIGALQPPSALSAAGALDAANEEEEGKASEAWENLPFMG